MLGLQGDTSYENWKYDKQANIVEVLEEFPSLKVNAELLLTQLPLLQPVSTRLFLSAHLSDSSVNLEGIFFLFLSQRFYSISSSQELYPGEVHVTVAVVRFTKRGKSAFIYIFVRQYEDVSDYIIQRYSIEGGRGPVHHGVCSTWLESLVPNDIVPCFVRQ